MKTNIFKLTFMAFAATMLIASCSQNEEQDVTNQNTVLAVATTIQDFTQDPQSRVIDTPVSGGYVTTFETGDQIGVYALTEDGTIMCKNMPMTYNATGKWESSSPLYFYKNATYIAYSPYTAALSTETITSIDDIKTYFINDVLGADVPKSYSECDLMTASATTGSDLPAANASAITFNFSHAMSMVEFVIPVSKYITEVGGYEYFGPIFGLELKKKENAGTAEDVKVNALGKGVYRTLLAPVASDNVTDKDLTFSGQLLVGDGTQPVYFETQAFRPTSGTYKKVNVSYDGAPDPAAVVERPLEVGDYYYSDGGIVHAKNGDGTPNTVIPLKNRIGVIYKVGDGVTPLVGDKKNACVIAFNDVKGFRWNDVVPGSQTLVTNAGPITLFADALAAGSGYSDYDTDCGTITSKLITFRTDYPAPETSTGWYIPSIGELITMVNGLQGSEVISASTGTVKDQGTNWERSGSHISNICAALEVTGGETAWWLWSVNESKATQVWAVNLQTNKIEVHSARDKNVGTSAPYTLRPVLAF